MLTKSSSAAATTTTFTPKLITILVLSLVGLETLLTTLALVPAQLWVRILPQASNAALSGPFPAPIAPVITVLLYLLPSLIGLLSRSWQRALLYATLPAWIGLGLFLIAATSKVGAFYVISAEHVTANVSVLEFYAALGGLGWLARNLFQLELK
ncbi:MAG TPA: hypothetical protein VL485_04115 [Ktedonobacteraceae bacterium]|nr:hypothetical protein [Ktedonobacteraceae bacterium]